MYVHVHCFGVFIPSVLLKKNCPVTIKEKVVTSGKTNLYSHIQKYESGLPQV